MFTCALRMPPPALFGFVKEGEGCPRLCHTVLNAKIIIGSLALVRFFTDFKALHSLSFTGPASETGSQFLQPFGR